MTREPEQILEDNLVDQLIELGYQKVAIPDEAALLQNLKTQLENYNDVTLTDHDFTKVINYLNKGSVFQRSKTLRDRFQLTNESGDSIYLEFFNSDNWLDNEFQVAQQITIDGRYTNRYDVTLLINGFPLVQIELKRRGLEMKEAFNQINRYHKHSYGSNNALFQYIQLFVISNGVNTKYYANNRKQSFKQTFFWADSDNKNITQLSDFAHDFLNPAHLGKMIARYIVLNETDKILMVLRPYQFYAVEAIIDRTKTSADNGYIWHTTGSGKTLTSFKASQLIMKLPEVHKVVFVVDRKDLDYQTTNEFNSFSKGSVDSTENTATLVKQLTGDNKLIVTTIQKLNTAIYKNRYLKKIEHLKDKKIVFIFDECHRSQFGDTHQRIVTFFDNHQLFGFTGTPIFVDNAVSKAGIKHTTKALFDKCLHKYVITDAIRDVNVLRFAIEYVGKYREKDGRSLDLDIKVEDIDTKELYDSPKRLEKIVDYIIQNHNRKTHSRKFTSIFCVSSIDVLTKYYEIFARKKSDEEHDLKIATIFSYAANEEDEEADGLVLPPETEYQMAAEEAGTYGMNHSRDKLESYIGDYNEMFQTNFTTKDSESFYNYYKDLGKRIKMMERTDNLPENNIDILLVVSMFLTGFDGKLINTLYVDKNLKQHGLIQAYSRTNRILNEQKSHGNVIAFRNLKKATDDAITLFSNKEAKEDIMMPPYQEFTRKFNEKFIELLSITPTVSSVDNLPSEDEEFAFVTCFRELMRLLNITKSYSEFSWNDLAMPEQLFEDFKSKYLDLHDKVKMSKSKEKESILDDVDFELELIHRDEINVAYILKLLKKLKDSKKDEDKEKQARAIEELLSGETQLRSKRELIQKFIRENLPTVDADKIEEEFEVFWKIERTKAFDDLVNDENLEAHKLESLIGNFLFTERKPLRDDIADTLKVKPKILERKSVIERVSTKIYHFMETFINGMVG
ncbi:type I restriction endonuclease subunit R [Marinoscillum sp.]|uniref:type I restriction endonuclease subunit R n=1 Tax=Marinoscillum sp. TaxID=2024838 RepID=UPI003BA918AE